MPNRNTSGWNSDYENGVRFTSREGKAILTRRRRERGESEDKLRVFPTRREGAKRKRKAILTRRRGGTEKEEESLEISHARREEENFSRIGVRQRPVNRGFPCFFKDQKCDSFSRSEEMGAGSRIALLITIKIQWAFEFLVLSFGFLVFGRWLTIQCVWPLPGLTRSCKCRRFSGETSRELGVGDQKEKALERCFTSAFLWRFL